MTKRKVRLARLTVADKTMVCPLILCIMLILLIYSNTLVYVSQSEWDDCISLRRTRHRNGATDTGYVHGSISSLQCFLFCPGVEPR